MGTGRVKTSVRGRLTYENCKGAVGVADDVQVFRNEETHDKYAPGIECMQ